MTVQWYTAEEGDPLDRLTAAWGDAPIENLEVLGMILSRAKAQVIVYAPELDPDDEDAEYPDDYAYAQLQQAINLWNAGSVNSEGQVGGFEGFSFTPRPLDKTIRTLIRPIDGRPDVY